MNGEWCMLKAQHPPTASHAPAHLLTHLPTHPPTHPPTRTRTHRFNAPLKVHGGLSAPYAQTRAIFSPDESVILTGGFAWVRVDV